MSGWVALRLGGFGGSGGSAVCRLPRRHREIVKLAKRIGDTHIIIIIIMAKRKKRENFGLPLLAVYFWQRLQPIAAHAAEAEAIAVNRSSGRKCICNSLSVGVV